MTFAALLLAVGATLAWATTWVLMKAGVDRMSPVAFGFLRPAIGLPLIAAWAFASGNVTIGSPGLALLAAATGFLNAFVGTWLFYFALHRGSMHETNILANTGPFWGVASAIAFLGEPVRLVTIAAGLLVVAGTALLVRAPASAARPRRTAPVLAALATGVLWGFTAAVPTKYGIEHGTSPVAFQLLFTVGAAVSWTAVALPGLRRGRLVFTRRGTVLALVSSVLGLFLGWILWLLALERAPASALSPLVGLILLFATVLGAIFLRERLTGRMAAGGALILAGVTLVSAFTG